MSTFDKQKFAELLKLAKGENRSINQYALQSDVSSAHISRLMREMLNTAPGVGTISKLADKARNNITYYDLMVAAGYINSASGFLKGNAIFNNPDTLSDKDKTFLVQYAYDELKQENPNLNFTIDDVKKALFDGDPVRIDGEEYFLVPENILNELENEKNRLEDENNRLENETTRIDNETAILKNKNEIIRNKIIKLKNENALLSSILTPIGDMTKIPVLGRIPAGMPIEAVENIIDYVEVPKAEVSNGEYFYLQVIGDSMIGSRIYEGDRVLIRKQSDIESGEIAVVRTNGYDATLKRVKKVDGQVILYPDNPNYEPIIIDSKDAIIIGKVIKVEFDPNKK